MATTTTDALNGLLSIYNGESDARWNYPDAVGSPEFDPAGIGNSVALTYSFLDSRPAWATTEEVSVGAMDGAMRAATEKVLDHIETVADIRFTEVLSPRQGQITFATSDQGTGSSAWAYLPYYQASFSGGKINSVTEVPLAGSVWVNNSIAWSAADWNEGAFGYSVLLHEMGHALGLKHPFEAGLYGDGYVLADSVDNERYTVMSYTSAPRSLLLDSNFNSSILSPSTMMVKDIEALQHLYGANMSTASGNTVHAFGRNQELLETIWDAGGRDILDCSNQTLSCRISLIDGDYSSIGIRTTDAQLKLGLDLPTTYALDAYERANLYNGVDNLGIAKGAVIEDARGGSAADTLLGNSVANRLFGGNGADRASGGLGNDRLDGGNARDVLAGQAGNDVLVGGAGADRLDGGTGRDVFKYNRLTDTGSTEGTADVIAGFVSGQDRIDLSTLDADAGDAGNQDFTFIGLEAFTAAGQVRYAGGVLYATTDADATAEFAIQLSGVALIATDLVL